MQVQISKDGKFRKEAQQESETGDEESRDEKINNKKVKKAAQHVDLSTNEIPQLQNNDKRQQIMKFRSANLYLFRLLL